MNHELRDAVIEGLTQAAKIQRYPKDRTPDLIGIWCEALGNLPPDLVRRAFAEHRRSAPDFPVPSEIRELAKSLYRAPTSSAPALPEGRMTVEQRDAIKAQMSEGGRKMLEAVTEDRRIGFRRVPGSKVDDNPPATRTHETEALARQQITALKRTQEGPE